jgi:ABC-type multidrug transport system fused ATPase/permease subunit
MALPAIEAVEIWLFKVVVDGVLVPRDLSPLAWIALAYVALAVLSAGLSFVEEYAGALVGERFLLRLRTDVLAGLLRRSPDGLDRSRRGDILARLTSDAAAVERLVPSGISELVGAGLRVVVFTAALFVLDWTLALVSLTLAPLLWAAARRFSGTIRRAAREHRRRGGSATAVAEDVLGNLALVQSHNRENDELARFVLEGELALRAELRASRLRALMRSVLDVLEVAAALAVIIAGTWALTASRLTLGEVLVFLTFLGQLYRPVRDLTDLSESAFTASAGAERLIELLDTPPEIASRPGSKVLTPEDGEVRFEGVTFAYPGSTVPALSRVTFRVSPGETVALVGPSGSGKSTLVKLLLRFQDPNEGAVMIDGCDVRDVRLDSLRRAVCAVLQDSLAVDGTIAENVTYGLPSATDEQIAGALRATGLDAAVEVSPLGIETAVGPGGRALSGGQRRRLALARVLLRGGPILVLDEPLTGLDAASASELREAIGRWARGRTTLVVAHDLSLAQRADRIVVLDRGRIVEQGRHADLVAGGGVYADLWQTQPGRDAGPSERPDEGGSPDPAPPPDPAPLPAEAPV